ncbi:hypothetical protein [Kordiimonas aestuarii]|uniref:hypothetical protein n=1 Tax=Kordiimonas aestuarii TaxID=1005925 RepID=UPI0021CFA5B7|nr:hypothetical protein [Kordiimonas aestuarii]
MDVKNKVLKHLDDMGDTAKAKDGEELIDELAERYDAPREAIEQIIADWMAGEKKDHKE